MPVICTCVGLSFGFALAWMVLLRYFTALIVWLTLLVIAVAFAAACWWTYAQQEWMRTQPDFGSDELFTQQTNWLTVAFYACAVSLVVYCLLVVCARSRIHIAIRVMKEATRAVGALPLLLLLPLLTLACFLGLLAYGLLVALLLASRGELQYGRSGFGHLLLDSVDYTTLALHVFGVLWLTWFFRHLQDAAVAGAVARWYFAADKRRDVGCCPVVTSYCTALRYHTGSIALGSLLITTLQLLRFFVLLLSRRCAS